MVGRNDYDYYARLKAWEKQQNDAETAVQKQRKVLMDLVATRTQYQKTLSEHRRWQKQEAEKKAAEAAGTVEKGIGRGKNSEMSLRKRKKTKSWPTRKNLRKKKPKSIG